MWVASSLMRSSIFPTKSRDTECKSDCYNMKLVCSLEGENYFFYTFYCSHERRPPNQPPKWGIFKLVGKEGLVVKDVMPKGRKPRALSWSSGNDALRASPELTWLHLWWDQVYHVHTELTREVFSWLNHPEVATTMVQGAHLLFKLTLVL